MEEMAGRGRKEREQGVSRVEGLGRHGGGREGGV